MKQRQEQGRLRSLQEVLCLSRTAATADQQRICLFLTGHIQCAQDNVTIYVWDTHETSYAD
jgi:hypothetical protein